jgi:hypothetical protein
MSYRNELAVAAAEVRERLRHTPPELRPDIAPEWGRLLDRVQAIRTDGGRTRLILEWRQQFRERFPDPRRARAGSL